MNEASVYDRLAWSLASDKEYVSKDGTPTAFRPVGYPGFLAGVYLVFGRSWIVGGIANALLGTVTVGLTYMLARTVLSIRLSLAAALLIALLPSHIFGYTAVLRMEALHTVFVLCALVLTYWAVCAPRVQNAVLLGLCLGIGVYVRPILLLWASDADWVTFARAINMSIFQDQFQHGIPALKWFTQLYWAAIALMAAGAVLVRPLRYWLSFPANLFPVLVVYWTMFHMAFFWHEQVSFPSHSCHRGTGRPLVVERPRLAGVGSPIPAPQ